MKTRRLIELLTRADPSGELECVVGREDILGVARMPPYWDGAYEVLVRDESRPDCYNVAGGEIRDTGPDKVKILTHGLGSAIMEDPELPVTCPPQYAATVGRWRQESREVDREIAEGKATGPAPPPGD